jgi:hypothetical protein
LLEISNSPELKEYSKQEMSALLTNVYDTMTDPYSGDHSNPTADRLKQLVKNDAPKNLKEFISCYLRKFHDSNSVYLQAQFFLPTTNNKRNNNNSSTSNSHNNNGGNNNNNRNHNTNKKRNNNHNNNNHHNNKADSTACNGCGRKHSGECKLTNHPDYNKESVPWIESSKGKLWSERTDKDNNAITVLPWSQTLNAVPWQAPPIPSSKKRETSTRGGGSNHTPNKKRSKYDENDFLTNTFYDTHHINTINNNSAMISNTNINTFTIPCVIQQIISHKEAEAITTCFQALIDTGALHGNYINLKCFDVVSRICVNDNNIIQGNKTFCTALGDCVEKNTKTVNLTIAFPTYNDLVITTFFTVIDSPFDIIVGLPTILENNLLPCFFPQQYHNNIDNTNNNKQNTMLTIMDTKLPL